MTSKLTRERLEEIRDYDTCVTLEESAELARMALAGMDSEPVAWDYEWASCITCEGPQDFKRIIEREAPPDWAIEEGQARKIIPLYRHAQQPVVDIEPTQMFGIGSIFKPQVVSEQEADCDDCAHYNPKICHGEGCPAISQQSAQPAPVVLDDTKLRELFDSWFASDCSFDLSPEASEADNIAWRESYWYVWQRCSAAMLQAGNSPEQGGSRCGNSSVIPDGYVMVPINPTGEMQTAGGIAVKCETTALNKLWTANKVYQAMLAAAPQEVKGEHQIRDEMDMGARITSHRFKV
ncbi:TPA: hypothetical protein ACUE4H_003447 [Klebsiella quasipneumoniae]